MQVQNAVFENRPEEARALQIAGQVTRNALPAQRYSVGRHLQWRV